MNEMGNKIAVKRIEAADSAEVELNLTELFYAVLKKSHWIILLAAIFGFAAWLVSTKMITPLYTSTAKMFVLKENTDQINYSDYQMGAALTLDYQEVFKLAEVHNTVKANLSLNYSTSQMSSMLSIVNPRNTRFLDISFTSQSPQEAAMVANEYVTVAQRFIETNMKTLRPSITSAAIVPSSPSSPNVNKNVTAGAFVGAALVLIIILIVFMTDDKIKSPDDINHYVGIYTLAVIPVLSGNHVKKNTPKPRRIKNGKT